MNKIKYLIYCILFFLGINLCFFFSLFGFLLLYNYSDPFLSSFLDWIGFTVLSIFMTYLSAILTFWGYYGIRKLKRNLFLKPFKDAVAIMTRVLPVFLISGLFLGYMYYPIYKPQSYNLGVLALFTALFYISLGSIGYLSATSMYPADMLEKEFAEILKKSQFNVLGMIILMYGGILLFIFILITFLLEFLYVLIPNLNSLLMYEIFFILYYPVYTIGILMIMIKKSKRMAIDFLFTDKLLEHSK